MNIYCLAQFECPEFDGTDVRSTQQSCVSDVLVLSVI
jgi:hypothetical protein